MKLRILSLGAGVQSTTLALMAARGEFPGEPLDGAIFADTQWEPRAVYNHLAWLTPLLPFPVHVVSAGSIREAILSRTTTEGGRISAIPWFVVNPDGSTGMGRRFCTREYKLTPITHKLRDLLGVDRRGRVARGAVEQWVGISRDEASRMKDARQQWIVNRWPLVERLMSRDDCLRWLKAHGYPTPPKSACIGCPFHNRRGWQEMKANDPEAFADAVAVDAALRAGAGGTRGLEYMHASRLPLAEAVDRMAPAHEPNLFEHECEGMCGV